MSELRPILKKWEQISFNFDLKISKAITEPIKKISKSKIRRLEVYEYCPPEYRCKTHGCMKRAAKEKVYCSKAHSPFGLLDDEPDNAPIEWAQPENYFSKRMAQSF